MPSKNNLSALKSARPAILPAADSRAAAQETEPQTAPRREKPAREPRTHKIQLSLTKAEAAALKKKAGLAREATFVHAQLKELGIFD